MRFYFVVINVELFLVFKYTTTPFVIIVYVKSIV